MGGETDKLFLELAGRPLIAHTWERFERAPRIDTLVLVIRPEAEERFRETARRYGFRKPYRFAPGGRERQDSVWNGLEALPPGVRLAAIHDGARPCVRPELIEKTLEAAEEDGAAAAASRVTDTIKESDGGAFIARHLDRSRLWSVQTPQTFRLEVIREALQTVRAKGLVFTDDTAACGFIGRRVRLVEWNEPNPKVTAPADVPFVEMWLRRQLEEAGRGGTA